MAGNLRRLDCFSQIIGNIPSFSAKRSMSAFRDFIFLAAICCLAGELLAAEFSETTVFVSGEGGYHTYRIPSVIQTAKGLLLAFCEGRKDGRSDAGNIDLLMKRSDDDGHTWSPAVVIWDDGGNTCGNPCPVLDASTGEIWMLLTWNSGKVHESRIAAGFGKDSRQVFVMSSRDDGYSWSNPHDITPQTKQASWTWYATGPGAGIQIQKGPYAGRLVIPCDHKNLQGKTLSWHSHVIFSDDHGSSWQQGGITTAGKENECEVVELTSGNLMLNVRNYDRSVKSRQTWISQDGGSSWVNQRFDRTLVEPICQASIRRWTWPQKNEPGVILFSNPASTNKRQNLTVRLSEDDARTWKFSKVLHAHGSAYSCLVALSEKSAGCLYEKDNYGSISFARFDQDWVKGEKSLDDQ